MSQQQIADIQIINKELIYNLLPKRAQDSHKGTYGHVLNVAGSSQYTGAAYFSSISALKVGGGHCMLASCSDVISTISAMCPDVTYIDLGQTAYGTIPKDAGKIINSIVNYEVISIGCGITTYSSCSEFLLNFLKRNKNSYTPVILDADAINIISEAKNIYIPLNTVITPHPLELSRLLDVDVNEIQKNRAKWAWEASREFDCVVLLKGHDTVIAAPNGKIFINHTGNSALSKAGTGDILTGMIAGFCAQGLPPINAASCAVFMHGLASEIAAKNMSEYCVLASDLIKYIPLAFKMVLGNSQ